MLTRVAPSHVRIGTFQFFAARGDVEATRHLADYVIARHYPEARRREHPYLALLKRVIARQADLVAQWVLIGFIHGVMNTDNMSIAGETIDYGPCAFMDAYHPETVFSSIDHFGRYAYGNQPRIAQWNLTRLAETLLPLLAEDSGNAIAAAQAALAGFAPRFDEAFTAGLRRKLGLLTPQPPTLFSRRISSTAMAANSADFTLTFRRLCNAAEGAEHDDRVHALFADPAAFDEWAGRWRKRMSEEGGNPVDRAATMRRANPAFIPRNHLVEEAISAAQEHDDYGPFETLLTVLATPYEDQPGFARYAEPPRPDQVVHQTFCGT